MRAKKRNVITYKSYFLDFYQRQNKKTQLKIEWVLQLIEYHDHIPERYLKQLSGTKGLYEIRIQVEGNSYRILCFFDKGLLIVLGNAFQKKTNKTPLSEIEKGKRIMEDYFNEKDID